MEVPIVKYRSLLHRKLEIRVELEYFHPCIMLPLKGLAGSYTYIFVKT